MLLQRLVEFEERSESSIPPRYDAQPVKYLVVLRADGTFLPPAQELSDGEERGKRNRGRQLVIPHVARSGTGTIPNLLVDNAEYALGMVRAREGRSERRNPTEVAAARHASFVALVRECATATDEPSVRAVLAFLDHGGPSHIPAPEEFDATARVGFEVRTSDGPVWPWELASVQRFWRERGGERGSSGWQCLVCGGEKPAVKTIATRIKRLPNLQVAGGAALVSFNAPAFTSYGLEQTENAPICEACGEGSHKALNTLIEGSKTSYRADSVQYVFWTKEPVDTDWGAFFDQPDETAVRALYQAAGSGNVAAVGVDASPFYATALSVSGARVVVRDWLETTVGRAKAQLARYFRMQELVDWDGSLGRPLGVRTLANATLRIRPDRLEVPAPNQELAPTVAPALLRVALTGGRLPESLLYAAVRRNRAEQRVLRIRAVLIKMTLMSWADERGGAAMVALDPANQTPGYVCGRLLAVIENIQRAALGNVNATVVDRFYGTASAAPMAVFSYLLKGAQPHLGKLRKERTGTYLALDRELQEVLSKLTHFPAVLSLEEQGLFALGYYHQRAADAAERRAASERRANQGQPADGDQAEDDA
jgi:CRISPR-associated protein Csd1